MDFGRTGSRAVIGRRRRHELEVAPALAVAPHLDFRGRCVIPGPSHPGRSSPCLAIETYIDLIANAGALQLAVLAQQLAEPVHRAHGPYI